MLGCSKMVALQVMLAAGIRSGSLGTRTEMSTSTPARFTGPGGMSRCLRCCRLQCADLGGPVVVAGLAARGACEYLLCGGCRHPAAALGPPVEHAQAFCARLAARTAANRHRRSAVCVRGSRSCGSIYRLLTIRLCLRVGSSRTWLGSDATSLNLGACDQSPTA